MCIIFVAHQVHPRYPLIIASNRDEVLDRPTQPMEVWTTGRASDGVAKSTRAKEGQHRRRLSLSGRDLVAGGTWLGITLPSRDAYDRLDGDNEDADSENPRGDSIDAPISLSWIAITNFREEEKHGRPSRGGLLMEYLDGGNASASSFVSGLRERGRDYNGFNLLVGDNAGIYYYGNRVEGDEPPKKLSKGIHGLSNGLLESHWWKVERGKKLLQEICSKDAEETKSSARIFHETLMEELLSDQTQPDSDEELAETFLDMSIERYLSSIFVPKGMLLCKDYGTISSTTILVDLEDKVSVLERTWHCKGGARDRWFEFGSRGTSKLDGTLLSQTCK